MQVTKPRKQRKMLFQAPLHRRYKYFTAPLAPELQKSHGVKSLPVRVGDTVTVTRGDHRGFEGKIARVDRRKYRVFIEGLTREKVDGTTIFVAIHPSKVMVTKLNLDDKWRKKILERKKTARKAFEEAVKAIERAVAKKQEKEKEESKPEKPKKPKAGKTKVKPREKRKKEEKPETKKSKIGTKRVKRKTVKRSKKTTKIAKTAKNKKTGRS
jgi:large subunit ribosomal protein L24